MKTQWQKILSSTLALSLLVGMFSIPAMATTSFEDGYSCGMEVHEHSMEQCYEQKVVCGYEDGEQLLVCENEAIEHVHDPETCYIIHSHNEDCYSFLLTCAITPHQHTLENCLSAEAQTELETVITDIKSVPTLQEMQDARMSYTSAKSGSSAEAAAAYEAYLNICWDEREAAQAAYKALTPAQKNFVSEDVLSLLDDELPLVFGSGDRFDFEIAADDGDEYIYTWPGASGSEWAAGIYEWSPHQNQDEESPVTFMLVDVTEYGGKTWAPDGPYDGKNNYVLAYCSDAVTPIDYRRYYKRINLEESSYYGPEQSEQIRAIVLNAYPFISEKDMHEAMYGKLYHENGTAFTNDEVDEINYVELLSAAQFAIWSYSNFAHGDSYEDSNGKVITREMVQYYGNTYYTSPTYSYHYVGNDLWCWWEGGDDNYLSDVADHIDAVVDYLRALPGEKPMPAEVVISNIDVLSVRTKTEPNEEGIVPIEISIRLNATGNERDALTLSVVGEVDSVSENVAGKALHTLTLDAKVGETLQLSVSGIQTLADGVYFYEAKPVGGESARDSSQNLVGIASGETPVYATATVDLDDTTINNPEDLYSVSFTKTVEVKDEHSEPEWPVDFSFTLTDVNTGKIFSAQKTFSAEGEAVVTFPSVYPGIYTLTEESLPEKWSTEFVSRTVIVEDEDVVLAPSEFRVANLYNGDALTYSVSFTKQATIAADSLEPSWPVSFSFTLTDVNDSENTYSATSVFSSEGEQTITFTGVPAGTYTLTENYLSENWSSSFVSETVVVTDSDVVLPATEVSIINTYNQPTTATGGTGQSGTTTKKYDISFYKQASIADGSASPDYPVSFTFELRNQSGKVMDTTTVSFEKAGLQQVEFNNVKPGTYTIVEGNLPSGWETEFEGYAVEVKNRDVAIDIDDLLITNIYYEENEESVQQPVDSGNSVISDSSNNNPSTSVQAPNGEQGTSNLNNNSVPVENSQTPTGNENTSLVDPGTDSNNQTYPIHPSGEDAKLPQTGLSWVPVLVLAGLGVVCLVAGVKKRKSD